MADINKLAKILFKWEGGFVNDPADSGGPTNMGVTLNTWKELGYDIDGNSVIDINDIRKLTIIDATKVLRIVWDRWQADKIRSQSVANILVDWTWMSGKWGIVIPQRLLNVIADGIVGPLTIAAVNAADPRTFHQKIWSERRNYIDSIIASNPSRAKFKHGWINRLNDFKFTS